MTYIVAEIGANHCGDIDTGMTLIRECKYAGADAVKFQLYRAKKLASPDNWAAYKDSELSFSHLREYSDYCKDIGIGLIVSPFDIEAVEFVDGLDIEAIKVASCDITNKPLLNAIRDTGRVIFMSIGESSVEEISMALEQLQSNFVKGLVLLVCRMAYPADGAKSALGTLCELLISKVNGAMGIGYSDHTAGTSIPIVAAALGAQVIEKHVKLPPILGAKDTLDSPHSITVSELAYMVQCIKEVNSSIGDISILKEAASKARRSIYTGRHPISKGDHIKLKDLEMLRPGTGISPMLVNQVVGGVAAVDIPEYTMIKKEMLR